MGWARFIDIRTERFGEADIQRRRIRERILENARWEDKSTAYIVQREIRFKFQDQEVGKQFQVFLTYLDKVLWDQRTSAEMQFLF